MRATFTTTGWLLQDAFSAVNPKTYRRVLKFKLMLKHTGADEPAPWDCEITDETKGEKLAPKLVAGAGVIVHAELCAAPFIDSHQVRTHGFKRWLAVEEVEFSRLPVAAEQPEPTATKS